MTRVLLVEDDADLAMISSSTLMAAGFDVTVAESVEDAFACCEDAEPDIALVDIQLPGHSGWDFIREVRESGRWPNMRLALHTVHNTEPDTQAQAALLGVDALLVKGDPEELVAAINRMMR